MDFIYLDESIAVCLKPAGILSTDEPGGMPELIRASLGQGDADVRTVHRLDRVVSGLMVFARSAKAASALSSQIRDGTFEKEYAAVIHWRPRDEHGIFRDLLERDAAERKTHVVKHGGKAVREAALEYSVIASRQGLSLVRIRLITGRTHQIRAQFSSRGLPLVGDRKYSLYHDDCDIALWSCRLAFAHPITGEALEFIQEPPAVYPWTVFSDLQAGPI